MGWKLGADVVARVLQYVLLWAAARSLGQADFGDFTFALSIGYMLAQVADFGLQLFVQRELARLAIPGARARPFFTDEAAAARLVGGGLAIKAGLSVVAMLLMALLVLVEPVGNKGPLLLIGFSMVLMTGLDYLSYCFRALRRLEYEATAIVVARCTNLLLGLGLLYLGAEVWGLAVAGNLAMLAALAFSYNRLLRYVRPDWRPDWTYWRRVSMQPTALGIGMVFSIISFRVDNLLIPPLVSREALGVYNVAYKLYEPSLIIPSVVLAATFPMLSQAAKPAPNQAGGLRDLLGQTSLLLFGLGLVATLAIALFAVPVISLLYGEQYAASAPLLQVLAFGCLPMYLNYGLTHTLIAMDKPHLYAVFTLLTLAVNVIMNLALLPNIGMAGAAWATVVTEASLLALCAAAVLRQVARMPSPAVAEGPL
jgi:O-antigen/teichoic acid export membrane protein